MSKIAKATVLLMMTTMLSKFLGFLRELVLASSYGTSVYSDAYLIALNIPTILFAGISSAIATTFIPIYYDNINKNGNIKANKFTNNIINTSIIISILASFIVFLFTDEIVKIFAIGFEGRVLEICVNLTKILVLGFIFISLSQILSAYLQANDKFFITGLISTPYNLIIMLSILLSLKTNFYMLAWGTLIAIFSQLLIQLPFIKKEGYKYELYMDIKDEDIKRMLILIAPIFIGIMVNQVNNLVDKTLASTLVGGSISALNYASRLNGFVLGLFISSIVTVIYPKLSKLAIDSELDKFKLYISNSINSIIILIIPISMGAIILSKPIVKLLFERGAFDENATKMTAIALIFYSVGMVAFGLRDILGKVFYSLQDTKTPMINGVMSMVMNIILNIIFIQFMGHAGLALATSLSAIICIFLLFHSLKKKIGYFGQDKILKTIFKSLLSSVVMGIITYFTYNLLEGILGIGFIQEAIVLFVSIALGAIVYCLLVIVLKIEEVSMITNMIKKKITASDKMDPLSSTLEKKGY